MADVSPSGIAAPRRRFPVRFDRNELAGAFGDIGTDLPLLSGMILASGLDPTSVLATFGALQILSGLAYRLPMPVQPLKAVAAIVIAGQVAPGVLFGGGLAIGLIMLALTAAGALGWLARVIPRCVVRGIQFGLGIVLCQLALGKYLPAEGAAGYVLAAAATLLTLGMLGHRKYPPALLVIAMGLAYAAIAKWPAGGLEGVFQPALPRLHVPLPGEIWQGLLLLALPQIPLSLGNSVLATEQLTRDLFPERRITFRHIGLSYSCMNLIAPFFGGAPVCHGAGGMAGHYAFGARTGGSVVLYGAFVLALGTFFGPGFHALLHLFPLPLLGVVLLFESLALMRFLRDVAGAGAELAIALLVGVVAAFVPYGFLIGMLGGTAIFHLSKRCSIGFLEEMSK